MKMVVVVILTFVNTNGVLYSDFNLVKRVPLEICLKSAQIYNNKPAVVGKITRMLCLEEIGNSSFL